jgi:natural product precursor
MKQINKFKLTQFNKIEKKQMNAIRGGICQQCACGDSSSTYSNMNTNALGGYTNTYEVVGDNDACAILQIVAVPIYRGYTRK